MNFRTSIRLAGMTLAAILLSSCNFGATPPPTQDVGIIQTEAVNLVLTQVAGDQTQTAAAIPPTPIPPNTLAPTGTLAPSPTVGAISTSALGSSPTPFGFNTQQPGLTPQLLLTPTVGVINTVTTLNGCNDGQYGGETKPNDGDVIERGKEFSKGWTINNIGDCTWDEGYVFDYLQDYALGTPELVGYDIVLKKNQPETYTPKGYGQTFIVKLKAPTTPGDYKAYWKLKDDAGNYFGPLVYVFITVK